MLYTRSVTACAHRMLSRTYHCPPHRSEMSVSRPLCCSVAIDGSDDAEAFITHIQTNVSSRRIVVRRATV
eukprot:scaffold8409_cov60-Phaeocystis_antarctica.AAC.1